MMVLGYKFTIFLVFTTVYVAKTQDNHGISLYDFKKHTLFPNNDEGNTRLPYTYTSTVPPIFRGPLCPRHSHIFSFSNVGLQKIGRDFINSNDIINLRLDDNNISDISPFAFRNMRNLQYLDLSGNKIPKEKLLSLTGNEKLEVLIIDNNRDSHNPMTNTLIEYEVFSNLKYLHLCNSQLGNFQVPFQLATPILTHLYLNNNSISSSDVVFENIPATLTHLHLKKNLIDRVKQGKLRNLRELIMDDNAITQVCFEDCEDKSISLKDAVLLQNLSLANNLISEISPDAFSDTRHLSILDLSGNKITDVAKNTFNNTISISALSLANNTLATVPDVCSMFRLRTLDLSENRISAILSGTFCPYLTSLEYLYLSNNAITTIQYRAFHNLQKLKYLDLSGNRLRELPMNWGYTLFIQELHLERNNFTELDNISLINLKELTNVYLDENPMPILRAESFRSLPGHLRVHLKNMRVEDKCAQCQCDNDEEEGDNEDDNHNNYNDDNSI
ncbi:podocan-like protein 1 [Temnothorax longispinosus]|uniref:podocan-like protein 1 n=1 Tax=Temnothorax longispinosus TaxID=300112 RepID=UPI003A99CE7E